MNSLKPFGCVFCKVAVLLVVDVMKIINVLEQESTVFELHQAMGIEHRTIASCKIRFHELLERPQGKLHGSATLIGGWSFCGWKSDDH